MRSCNMGKFDGFTPDIQDILLGIRFNNNKEWFDAHKEQYKRVVHEPITAFANELYEKFKRVDPSFDAVPKVCRAYRDTRFTKNKERYKDTKWFFLRSDGKSGIVHEKPTIYFEIMPESYQYGFGYWAEAKNITEAVKRMAANPAETERHAQYIKNQDFFTLEGEYYKKSRVDRTIVPNDVYDWCQRKNFTFSHVGKNEGILFEQRLLDDVFEHLMDIYPIYKFFDALSV